MKRTESRCDGTHAGGALCGTAGPSSDHWVSDGAHAGIEDRLSPTAHDVLEALLMQIDRSLWFLSVIVLVFAGSVALIGCTSSTDAVEGSQANLQSTGDARSCPPELRARPDPVWRDKNHYYWCANPAVRDGSGLGYPVHIMTTPAGDVAVSGASGKSWGVGVLLDGKASICSSDPRSAEIEIGGPAGGKWTITDVEVPSGSRDGTATEKAVLTLKRDPTDEPMQLEVACRPRSCGLLPGLARSLCFAEAGVRY